MSRWTAPLSALADRLALPAASRREIQRFDDSTPVPLGRTMGYTRGSLFGDTTASRGYLAQLDAYGDDSTIFPIVSRLAEDVGALEWSLWTKSASGTPEDRRPVRSHAVLDLLAYPNDFQSFNQIVEAGQQHFDIVGELDIILGFVGGVRAPLDMWLLRPDRIQPVPDKENFLAGWVYISPDGGERIPVENRELMRTLRPSPVDPYRGMGPIQSLMRDLDAQRASRDWQAAFFENSARPNGIIQFEIGLNDDQFNEFRDRWYTQHQGQSKAHRVAILENNAKWVETSYSMRDLQVAELENVARDKALVAFGMPKSVLGIVEDVNRANADAGEYLYAMHMIRPRARRWRAMLNRALLPLFGPSAASRLELDFADPVPENGEAKLAELDTKARVVTTLISGGMDAAKVLELVDWPDLGYVKPEVVVPTGGSMSGDDEDPTASGEEDVQDRGQQAWTSRSIDAAMRWKVVGHPDSNCCDPCMKNLGKLYRNRQDAWSDYPGGRSYIACVGEKYGNHCRCRVIKRRDGR